MEAAGRPWRLLLLLLLAGGAAIPLSWGGPAPTRAHLLELQAEALARLRQVAAAALGVPAAKEPRRAEAAGRLETLAGDAGGLLSAKTVEELRRLAADLRSSGSTESLERGVRLLERVGTELGRPPLGLEFKGSYAETRKPEAAVGGHASSMGPAPMPPPFLAAAAGRPSPVSFEEGAQLPVKTMCGGPTKDHILESVGSGVGLLDYDGDGLLDIYLVNAFELGAKRELIPHKNALFRNRGGWKFEDVSAAAGVDAAAWGNGVCVGDYDDDGRLDMYVTSFGGNALFRNNGNGTFTEAAAAAGVRGSGWSTGCSFFDADGDGDLDLYVARYVATSWDELAGAQRTLTWRAGPKVMVGPLGLPGEADLFFENRGDGTFVEAGAAHGLVDTARTYGLGVVSTDYDGDGRPDLFVANDTNPNLLFHNLGRGRFENGALVAGVAVNAAGRAQAGMGVDAGDYDGDGQLDLVLTTFAHDAKTLFRNLGQGLFEDVSEPTGLAAQTFKPMGWGVSFLDADLDGRPDLFIANGHIFPNVEEFPALQETFRQKNQLLLNIGSGFRDVSETAGPGLQLRKVGRGLAVGDLDNDGDPDVVVSNLDDTPTVLENRQHTGNHWIAFRLEKPGRNRFAIGARVTIDAAGRRQVREVRSGGSYLSQGDLRPEFGLGTFAGSVDVEVRLAARTWRFKGLAIDRIHTLTLGDD